MGPNDGVAFQPLLMRLQVAQVVVDAAFVERHDRRLVRSLADGSFDDRDLDNLFAAIERPFRASVVYLAANMRLDPRLMCAPGAPEDAFCRAVELLSKGQYRSNDTDSYPVIDLFDGRADQDSLGRKGAIQIGIIQRLLRDQRAEALQRMIVRAAEALEEFIHPRLPASEIERIMRLMGPVERAVPIPMLFFRDNSGRVGYSLATRANECAAAFQE